jgi:hypothetical protein
MVNLPVKVGKVESCCIEEFFRGVRYCSSNYIAVRDLSVEVNLLVKVVMVKFCFKVKIFSMSSRM